MKKKKLNLPKLSLNKEVIGQLSQDKIMGGATVLENTCRRSCFQSCITCFVTCLNCVTLDVSCPVTACK
ncbi:class I lanthipeptide [Chitinophaga oryzae]|uniref:Class I lanthipeptide n=1 Tax=Chitinophaga oryzae TaxID=2725414 RepID=A0AAE6ZF90_9BACT|nr:class I lanthipeptide [Chitinophaga oryzae]QJB31115.1 class I lanthipeptide [Chitinophaga oryzae]QJB37600.1 class I lanthipeptide [Chitinophaga oryzae]